MISYSLNVCKAVGKQVEEILEEHKGIQRKVASKIFMYMYSLKNVIKR